MQTNFVWPLMVNNVNRSDLDLLIEYLKQDDPRLTHGPSVAAFEEAWSDWLGVKHSVMLNSGASANDLTMLALREMFGSGEVIVIKKLERDVGIELLFNTEFETIDEAKFGKISLESEEDNAQVGNYIKACIVHAMIGSPSHATQIMFLALMIS